MVFFSFLVFLAFFSFIFPSCRASCGLKRLSRNALLTTQKLDKLIAAAQNMGFNVQPNSDTNAPAANGIPKALYMNAQKRFSIIILLVARLRRIAAATSFIPPLTSTTSAESIAMSVPLPIAIPISARVSAGASFTPSPTIATFPNSESLAISPSFPLGSTSETTSSTHTCCAIALAVRELSPVSITTFRPIFFNSATPSFASAFTSSATAIMPASRSFLMNSNGVLPCSDNLSA